MTSHYEAAHDQATSVPAVGLALKVLFGDAFVASLEPAFVESIANRAAAWGDALKALWALSGGTGTAAAPAPPVSTPAPIPAVAPAPVPVPAAEATGHVELFDPSLQQDADADALRDKPWAYEEVRDALVALLEESTGYPAEVLDDDADLEADLAIDSVKQVEALGALRERYGLTLEDDFAIRDYRTIRTASTYLMERLNSERVSAAVA
ncbi:acyl carrier protein [Streptomyces sp. NPDC054933]